MPQQFDAIVIGAGHNGLACAAYLARTGLSVLVLEQYSTIGGMTITEELTLPGFWSDVHASGYQLANLSPAVGELDLIAQGIELIEPTFVYGHAFSDGSSVAIGRDVAQNVAHIGQFSAPDAAAWQSLTNQYLAGKERFVAGFFSPPGILSAELGVMEQTPDGLDAYRFSLQSSRAFCDATFETDRIKSLFGAFGQFVGNAPDDAGGAEAAWLFAMVLQDAGNNLVKGGMHHVSHALAADLHAHGGEIRTDTAVFRIHVANGRATGVELAGGEVIPAGKLVVVGTDPGHAILDLLGPDALDGEVIGSMQRYEWGDATMVIWVALEDEVAYRASGILGQAAHVHLTPPSLGALAESAAQCRAGRLPETPLIVSWNDSAIDPIRAPAGKALKKFVILGVPYEITGDATGRVAARSWDEAREPYADYLIDMIDGDYLPGLKGKILRRTVHSPLDLERKLRSAVRGTIGHGATLPYQMGPMRPIPQLAHYRTPVPNVYLCSSGTHPGPGVSMGPGRNAARIIYGDLGLDFAATAQGEDKDRSAAISRG